MKPVIYLSAHKSDSLLPMHTVIDSRGVCDGLSEQEDKRTTQSDLEKSPQALLLISVGITDVGRIKSFLLDGLSNTLRLAVKDSCVSSLRQCCNLTLLSSLPVSSRQHTNKNDPESTQDPHDNPDIVSPTKIETDIPTYDEGQWRSTCATHAVNCHGRT